MRSPIARDVTSWSGVRQHLLNASTPEINVPKEQVPSPASAERFEYADLLSYNPETGEVYRDQRAMDSLQVRVFGEYYNVQLDWYNPEYYPVRHLTQDVIGKEYREIEPLLRGADQETLQEIREEAETTDDNYLLGIVEDALN